MNHPLDTTLTRYLDGDLPPARARAAGEHLAGCLDCRAKLARLQALSALLAETPPAAGLKPEARFLAEVGLRLERRTPVPSVPALAEIVWHLVPVGLLLALAFIETVALVNLLVGFIPGADQALGGLNLSSSLSALAGLPAPLDALLPWLGGASLWNWNVLTGLAALAVTGLIAMGWLAGWYARSQRAARNRA